MNPAPTPVAVIEDDLRQREDLAALLAQAHGFQCVAAWASAEEALAALPQVRPRVVLVDLELTGLSGLDFLRRVARLTPDVLFLVVSQHEDDARLFNALEAGACGYLHKPVQATHLLAALHDALGGGAPMTPGIARRVVKSFQKVGENRELVAQLTVQEREILDAVAQGTKIAGVAAERNCHHRTISYHLAVIYDKLRANGLVNAVARYVSGTTPATPSK